MKAAIIFVCTSAILSAANTNYYPLTLGNSWKYSGPGGMVTMTVKVTEYSQQYSAYVIESTAVFESATLTNVSQTLIGKKGNEIVCFGNKAGTIATALLGESGWSYFEKPQIILALPINLGTRWEILDGGVKTEYKVVDFVTKSVSAGVFENTAKIEYRQYDPSFGTSVVGYQYYAPDVGLILDEFGGVAMRELIDYSIKSNESSENIGTAIPTTSARGVIRESRAIEVTLLQTLTGHTDRVRSVAFSRSRLIASVDFPKTTFKASGGVNNPSVLIVQKFTREQAAQADKGVIDTAYKVFMAAPQTAGINNRSTPVYLRHPDGREQVDDSGNKIIDDEITAVPSAFRAWSESSI